MNPVTGDVMSEPAVESVTDAATREHRHWARPEPRVLHEAAHLRLEKSAEVRLRLQRRAPGNLRHHFRRAVVRFVVLAVADLASFGVMREVLRAVRDFAVAGEALAGRVEAMVPPGILNGWQYAAALFMGLLVLGNYGRGDQRHSPRRLFLGAALATALPLWMTIWTRGLEPVLVQYGLVTVLVWIGLLFERRTINRAVAWVRPPERNRMDALFVGPGAECVDAIKTPAFSAGSEYRPIGFVDTRAPCTPGALGRMSDLPTVLDASGAQVVVISGYLTEQQFREVVDAALAGGCQVLSVPRSVKIAGVHPTTVWRHGQALVELTRPTLKGWQLLLKRVVDLVGATAGRLLLSPVFGLVALAVKLESRGAALFGHRRVGLNGHTFKCYKFRSMHPDAENRLRSDPALYAEYVANNFKLPEDRDPRLTAVGRFLRRTSLDELPQLVNVFKGEMSLVGPRPIVLEELGLYGHGAPVFLSLKPGMTGAWQVNGRSHVGYPDRADMELEYVRSWSLASDLWILFRTGPAVLRRRGAH